MRSQFFHFLASFENAIDSKRPLLFGDVIRRRIWVAGVAISVYSHGMNFLSHAIPYLDCPAMAVATGIPDWLSVVDRKIRARSRQAKPFVDAADPELREIARGVIQHHEDDRWFHGTEAFVSTNLEFAIQLRDRLPGDAGFRPTFVGHILIEMLLDGIWIRSSPSLAARYYEAISEVGAETIQRCVNQLTGKPTSGLAPVIERFAEIRFLYDYLEPESLLFRLNQVMNRVGLEPLPSSLLGWLPEAEKLVESRRHQLLTGFDVTFFAEKQE